MSRKIGSLILTMLLFTGCAAQGATVTPSPDPIDTPVVSSDTAGESTPDMSAGGEQTPAPIIPVSDPTLSAGEPVGDDYFTDAAFFGNSLMAGLGAFGGLTEGDFYALTSASLFTVSISRNYPSEDGSEITMLEALGQKQYGKIYTMLGINEIATETPFFTELYGQLLDEIRTIEPDAEIVIMSLTPVTAEKSAEGWLFSEEHVLEYNAALRQLAGEKGCWYLDLVDALAGEDGYLPTDSSTDGIHLSGTKYLEWAEYLRTHYPPVDAPLESDG